MYSYAQTVQPSSPYQGLHRYLRNRDLAPGNPVPKLLFNVLNGGKALASKAKFSRFYLIIDFGSTLPAEDGTQDIDFTEAFLKIQGQLRKQVQTHKLGENGFKPGADGAYWNALENHNEAFKFVEDAIAAVGVNGRAYNL